ncbi:Gamma-crystallin related domain-containing protein [Schistosoma japonicum]|nr:Gamma-crystallin related domain-containing protein [Schistosoma japonicum]
MLTSLTILIVTLMCSAVRTSNETANLTEATTNSTKHENSKLLQGAFQPTQCLRLYSIYQTQYFWTDICDSNRMISPLFRWYTRSVCSPPSSILGNRVYWILYSQFNFHGSYIIIPPGICSQDIRRYGLFSISSILRCIRINQFSSIIYCYIPHSHPFWPYDPFSQGGQGIFPQNLPTSNIAGQQNSGGDFVPRDFRSTLNNSVNPLNDFK